MKDWIMIHSGGGIDTYVVKSTKRHFDKMCGKVWTRYDGRFTHVCAWSSGR
jgi:hypothetical protein